MYIANCYTPTFPFLNLRSMKIYNSPHLSKMATSEKPLILWLSEVVDRGLVQEMLLDDVDAEFMVRSEHSIAHLEEIEWGRVAVITLGTQTLDYQLMHRCPKLRLIVRLGIGVDNIDTQAASELGVCVCNVPDYGIEEVADSTMAHILALFRQTTFLHEALQKGEPLQSLEQFMAKTKAARRIRGKTLGLIGLGNIGIAVCNRAKAFGFHVIFHDPYVHSGVEKAMGGLEHVSSVEELISRSDCVSLHCPLMTETHGMISEQRLQLFKKEAFLVNTSRGALINEQALVRALREGKIAGAALDVYVKEPLVLKGSIFDGVPNLICTPHAAWYSVESNNELTVSALKIVRYALTQHEQAGIKGCLNYQTLNMEACRARWM